MPARNALKLLMCPQITGVYKGPFSAMGADVDFKKRLKVFFKSILYYIMFSYIKDLLNYNKTKFPYNVELNYVENTTENVKENEYSIEECEFTVYVKEEDPDMYNDDWINRYKIPLNNRDIIYDLSIETNLNAKNYKDLPELIENIEDFGIKIGNKLTYSIKGLFTLTNPLFLCMLYDSDVYLVIENEEFLSECTIRYKKINMHDKVKESYTQNNPFIESLGYDGSMYYTNGIGYINKNECTLSDSFLLISE